MVSAEKLSCKQSAILLGDEKCDEILRAASKQETVNNLSITQNHP
jgi:hypothetical protein